MITGIVRALEATIQLRIRGSGDQERQVEAVIDSGFTGSLTLSGALLASLGPSIQGTLRGIMADGSERLFDVHEVTVLWDGELRQIAVVEADGDPLVGMSLLSGYELMVQVRPDGEVRITQLV